MITVAGVTVIEARLLIPWTGVWQAELVLDIDAHADLPSGQVTIAFDTEQLVGTVDPKGSGRVGTRAMLRVLGGGGAWANTVGHEDFHNDAGVTSADVVTATATAAGEVAAVPSPVRLGVHFVRAIGPASRVLDGLDWHVDAAGVTQVQTRAQVPLDPTSYDLLEWYVDQQLAILGSSGIVWPGSVITDERIGTFVAHDVEQLFGAGGAARVYAWAASSDASLLAGALETAVHEFSGRTFLRAYTYTVVARDVDGRLELQSTNPEIPNVLPITVWPGMSGDSCDPVPGSEVIVEFVAGDPSKPVVRAFDDNSPTTRTIDAVTKIKLGKNAAAPAARGDSLAGIKAALLTFASNASAATTAAQIATAAGSLFTALGVVAPTSALKVDVE